MALADVRPRHMRDFVQALKEKTSDSRKCKGERLAPRTVRHIYALVRIVFKSPVMNEYIAASPVVLEKGILPKSIDKDPAWRATAESTSATRLRYADLRPSDRALPARDVRARRTRRRSPRRDGRRALVGLSPRIRAAREAHRRAVVQEQSDEDADDAPESPCIRYSRGSSTTGRRRAGRRSSGVGGRERHQSHGPDQNGEESRDPSRSTLKQLKKDLSAVGFARAAASESPPHLHHAGAGRRRAPPRHPEDAHAPLGD